METASATIRQDSNLFLNFIVANAPDLDIFDEDYAKFVQKNQSATVVQFADHIAQRYSYNYGKFIDSIVTLLAPEDEVIDYISDIYLNLVH